MSGKNMRLHQRLPNQLRKIEFHRSYTQYGEGSILASFGNTQVICTATITEGIPRFLKGSGQGWLTAEYSMLPRATVQRTEREAVRGKQSGRTLEIQRLIGRSLRHCIDLKAIGENTIIIDCDVIQADGGTRTAAITGACIALYDATLKLQQKNKSKIKTNPFKRFVAAVSVGIYQDSSLVDLDYVEDSNADTDMNVVMDEQGHFIEIQGTAEKLAFRKNHLDAMLTLAEENIKILIQKQRETVELV